jgi:HK97 family phage prohead protease
MSEIRALHPGYELRETDSGGRTLFGHFAVFNRWTKINSFIEGEFLEQIAPGAFRKTIRENRDRIRALFQHGQDPQVGDKPIADITELREDENGVYYEADLFPSVPELVLDGLRSNQYGASFRFEPVRVHKDQRPERSEHNPDGLPERTLKEVRLFEFGPVTFPAYAEATSDVRSLTDWFLFEHVARHPQEIRALLQLDLGGSPKPGDTPDDPAPAEPDAGTSTSGQARRATRDYLREQEEVRVWQL